jgi:hypothetical protein
MDAHQLGRAAAKRLAQGKSGFGDLLANGMRSAEAARGVLEKGAEDVDRGDLEPFREMARLLIAGFGR